MSDEITERTLRELELEEERLILDSLSLADAVGIGGRLLRLATDRGFPVLIEIRRLGRVAFRAALDGTTEHHDMYAAGKARVVERFGHSSLLERYRHIAKGTTFAEATGLDFPEFAPHGGGYPLAVRGTGVVGSAVVSGLAQEDDHRLIVEALEGHFAA